MAAFYLVLLYLASCGGQFHDEMQSYDPECLGEDVFHCVDGSCVAQAKYCDGVFDCADGTDENFCVNHLPDAVLCNQTHQYMCQDKKRCVPSVWVCNNETDCEDGSDELNCTALPASSTNSSCKGFVCDGGRCISKLWTCDGVYDCKDRTDEDIDNTCRHALFPHTVNDGLACNEFTGLGTRNYKCLDSSFCLSQDQMCDGIKDCRDGTDEGAFCAKWHTMCLNFTCGGNNTSCSPERNGPVCICLGSFSLKQYNYTTHQCEDVNDCQQARPQCSHTCENKNGFFTCQCDYGYVKDAFGYLCYAPGPEALLFFSTRNDIRYVSVKSKQQVVVASGIKQAHGVSYDGSHLYWVETAKGHQSIVRAQLDNIHDSKEVLVGLGLEDPGDIAVDWLGGNIYFSDAERGIISACRNDGSVCATIRTETRHPKFVTLDVKNGLMYWADWHNRAVIMEARMDGTRAEVIVDSLQGFATGLTVDLPNGRLYFVDKTIKVVKIDDRKIYLLFEEPFHHPYSIAVFENTVFWSDWTTNTLQTMDKLHGSSEKRNVLLSLDVPVFDMHVYHPVMMNRSSNPCEHASCTHLCLITSNATHVCACPDGMELVADGSCKHAVDYRAQYLVIGGGASFTRLKYDALGNPESHATHFDIGRVQAMAHDNVRDVLYVYDGQRKSINYIGMEEFTLGVTHLLIYSGLENVVDMAYDYATDSLYFLDSGRRVVEVVSLRTQQRAPLYRFRDGEIPVSLCIMSDYGRMLVALVENEMGDEIHVDSFGLDGENRKHVLLNNLMGPYVRLRYAQNMDVVFVSDEGRGTIDFVHPEGTGRENFREMSNSIASLAATDNHVFWTDRRTAKLFWSDVHEVTHKIRRIELSIFPNNTQLHVLATTAAPSADSPLVKHPCLTRNLCSHVCVQQAHPTPHQSPTNFTMGHRCLCPPGLLLKDGNCTKVVSCRDDEFYCHRTNECFSMSQKCDGKKDCLFGEDEEGCAGPNKHDETVCSPMETLCDGVCISKNEICKAHSPPDMLECSATQFLCLDGAACVERALVCDGRADCLDASDERPASCDTLSCFTTEFMCASGSCIPINWRCDGSEDCVDGSDEVECENRTCGPGHYQCRNGECIELSKRCDNATDCFDQTDEDGCGLNEGFEALEEKTRCQPGEYVCERNQSICLPPTARCNAKVECPGGTDEAGCDFRCAPHGLFECRQQLACVARAMVCDGRNDCSDGSDETPDACRRVNKTLSHGDFYPAAECHNGYLCDNGQCVEWIEVCDGTPNCFDGTDENGMCEAGCVALRCAQGCHSTPRGPRCTCARGYRFQPPAGCADVDECAMAVCSQGCRNTPGSFICSCHRGYALRSDRRSCKAVRGSVSVVYASGNAVRSVYPDYKVRLEYHDAAVGAISDLDVNVRKSLLYVASASTGKLIEVAVEWITGNVYFVDSTPDKSCLRVCNVQKRRCAKLQTLPSDTEVTALVVDPAVGRMFYCLRSSLEAIVRGAALSGRRPSRLATLASCTGLAADPYARRLYAAETAPSRLVAMDYDGGNIETVVSDERHLQAPRGLALFEGSLFYLAANTLKLNRCHAWGARGCEPYLYLVDASTFVLRHEALQRDDVFDPCARLVCDGVCVLESAGAACLCADGSTAARCPTPPRAQLPLFNGWSQQDYESAHHYNYTLITIVLLLFAAYFCLFLYYHFVRSPSKGRAGEYMQVRYQNNASEGVTQLGLDNPIIEMPTAGGIAHEFVNPLQFVRDIWRQSFHRGRPIGTAGLIFETPQSQQDSDTESDLDGRETKRIMRN
ncbi:unnamed protein product, partial [Iphiclides podalirius]